MSTDEAEPASLSWDGKSMTPIHDRLYRRSPSTYGAETAPNESEDCADPPPPPCVTVMEETAHASARKLLQALLNVDIDDADSVEAFQNRRRRDADLHRLMEKAISDTAWGAAKVAVAAMVVLAILHIKETRSFQEAAEADRSYRRLEAVLKATGHASGLTAGEINTFAEAMEASTLVTAEAVQDAASVLATFRSVSGDTFTRALSLAQDLATVFGQDLSATATQLGKALEDPTQGLTALRRVGISFTESERELITTLAETGRTAEAQRLILDALEKQVGSAGAAEAGGLTGATNRLGDAWGNLLKAIGRTPVIASVAQGALNILSSAIEGITGAIEDDPIGARIEAAKNRLLRAKEDLARIEAGGTGTPMLGQRFALDEQRQRVAALEAEVAKLEQVAKAESDAEAAAKARAEAGRKAAEAERLREALTGQRRDLDKALDQLANTPSERIALVNRELAETKKRLDALRAPDGANSDEVDSALAKAEEIARRKIAQINQPAADQAKRAQEDAARKAAAEQAAAERAYQSNAKIIDDLARQLATFGDERRQFVDQALERLSAGAGDTQRQEVERLANALYDEKAAREQLIEKKRVEQALDEEGARLKEALRTPTEQLAATLAHLNALERAGAIDAETHDHQRPVGEADNPHQPGDRRDRNAPRVRRQIAEVGVGIGAGDGGLDPEAHRIGAHDDAPRMAADPEIAVEAQGQTFYAFLGLDAIETRNHFRADIGQVVAVGGEIEFFEQEIGEAPVAGNRANALFRLHDLGRHLTVAAEEQLDRQLGAHRFVAIGADIIGEIAIEPDPAHAGNLRPIAIRWSIVDLVALVGGSKGLLQVRRRCREPEGEAGIDERARDRGGDFWPTLTAAGAGVGDLLATDAEGRRPEHIAGDPSPVGIFPAGTTPDGVVDMAGNVLEWCLDAHDEGFYGRCAKKGTARNPVATGDAAVPRVLRGGSCDVASGNLRASYRDGIQPEFRDGGDGFRCVLAPPRQP